MAPAKDKFRSLVPAIRIALIYAIVAGVWIFASDHLLGVFVQDVHLITQLATYKGLVFVIITALMLFGLVRHAIGFRLPSQPPSLEVPRNQDIQTPRLVWPLVAFLVMTLFLVALASLALRHQHNIVNREEEVRLTTIARFTVQRVDDWLENNVDRLEYSTAQSLFSRTVDAWNQSGQTPGTAKDTIQERIQNLADAWHAPFVAVRDSEGKVTLSTGDQPEADGFATAAREAVTTLKIGLKVTYTPTGHPFIHMFAPLTVKRSRGVLAIGCQQVMIDPERQLIPFTESSVRGSAASVLMVDVREGHLRALNHDPRTPLGAPYRELLERLPKQGQTGMLRSRQYQGALVWSKHLPWGILITADGTSAFKATQPMASYLALLALVFAATGISAIVLWMRLQRNTFEQRQARQAMEQRLLAQRLEYLSKFANDIVLLFDEEGRILDANDRACTAYQREREDLLKLTILDLRSPDSLGALPNQWQAAKEGGANFFETIHHRRDGSTFPVEVSSRRVEFEGRLLVQSIIRDISERKASEEELKQINKIQRLILDNSAVGIGLVRHRIFDWVNPRLAEMLGSTQAQLQGSPTRLLYLDEASYKWVGLTATEHMTREEWFDTEIQFRCQGNDHTIWLRLLGKAIDAQQPEEGAIWIFEDITERKASEEALRQAQKLESLGVLAGGIAHDFNNLLTAILGNLNLAQSHIQGAHPAHDYLDNVEKTIQKAADLTRQMLAYSGKGNFVVKPHDLNQIVSEMASLLEVSIPKKVALSLELAATPLHVMSDATQIQQVVMNLVTNAADAIGDEVGTISISTRMAILTDTHVSAAQPGEHLPPGTYALLEVRDTGCGMAPEVLDRIFDPFFTTKRAGRGLGLSAMMGILRAHKAGLHILSQPGKGSCFEIYFPTTQVEGIASKVPESHASEEGVRVARILLVDDEAMIRETASAAMEDMGMSVTVAVDGIEALEQFQVHAFDLVILDLTMPRMDGRETFRRLREQQEDLPVIVCSGYTEQESILDSHGHAPTRFLQKPYSLKSLRKAIGEVLNQSPSNG